MSLHPTRSDPTASPWRDRYRVSLFAVAGYSAAIAWQCQLVSYPLFRAVGGADFPAYHGQYSNSIPIVVIAPGFLAFLGSIGYWWTRPSDESRGRAGVVALSGLGALLATVAWAIPQHIQLDRIGRSLPVIDSLLQANLLRSTLLTIGTLALGWSLGRRLTDVQASLEQGSASRPASAGRVA